MAKSESPFEEGDRVDHKLFGFGTVVGAPVAMVGADLRSPSGLRDAGWVVPVKFDDPSRTADRIGHTALTKVSSATTRPYGLWERQWRPLLEEWKAARRRTEQAYGEFRPPQTVEELDALHDAEKVAYQKLEAFLAAERDGNHA